jgi:hypothetical protein
MRYILSGDPKEVTNVVRELSHRVRRGGILLTPLADCEPSLEDKLANTVDDVSAAQKALKEQCDSYKSQLEEKDNEIAELQARISVLESSSEEEPEAEQVEDTKDVELPDTKEVTAADKKTAKKK